MYLNDSIKALLMPKDENGNFKNDSKVRLLFLDPEGITFPEYLMIQYGSNGRSSAEKTRGAVYSDEQRRDLVRHGEVAERLGVTAFDWAGIRHAPTWSAEWTLVSTKWLVDAGYPVIKRKNEHWIYPYCVLWEIPAAAVVRTYGHTDGIMFQKQPISVTHGELVREVNISDAKQKLLKQAGSDNTDLSDIASNTAVSRQSKDQTTPEVIMKRNAASMDTASSTAGASTAQNLSANPAVYSISSTSRAGIKHY